MGGANSHPSPVELINRIRKLCLTRNITTVVTNPSVEISNDGDDFVSALLFDDLYDNMFDDNLCNVLPELPDDIHEFSYEKSEPSDYVAGFICKKLKLEPNKRDNLDSWISLKGGGKLLEPSDELREVSSINNKLGPF